jgi:hypothetical protein
VFDGTNVIVLMMTPVFASIRVLLIGLSATFVMMLLFEKREYKSSYYCHYSHFHTDVTELYATEHTLEQQQQTVTSHKLHTIDNTQIQMRLQMVHVLLTDNSVADF